MECILYKSKESANNFSYYLVLFVFLALAGVLLIRITENPVFISILVSIILFIVGAISKDSIVVTETGFEMVFKRIIPLFSTSKRFVYSDIESIEADLPLTRSNSIFYELASLMISVASAPSNNISISFKNGKEKKISSNVYRDSFHEAFMYIRKAGNIPITINDIPLK